MPVCFNRIQKAVAADGYAFFTGFFQDFYNTDLPLAKRVSEQTSRPVGTSRPAPPLRPAWRVSQCGTKTSARTWHASMCPRW
jgi:hypothetical protein